MLQRILHHIYFEEGSLRTFFTTAQIAYHIRWLQTSFFQQAAQGCKIVFLPVCEFRHIDRFHTIRKSQMPHRLFLITNSQYRILATESSQIAQFMDLVIDTDQMIFVNNEEAGLDTLVYENFSVEWKTDEYGVARIDNNTYNDTQESDTDEASVLAEQDANSTESDNTVARTSEQMMNQVLDELHDDFAKEAEASAVPENELPENELPKNDIQEEIHEEDSSKNTVTVIVNGEPVELSGKDTYIFVDIFTHISFDLQAGKGRAIATVINGRDARFSEELHEGDKIELYWKEN